MPRFAANLTMLFTELPFLDRFAAARAAGFHGVEFLFPYDVDKTDLRDRLHQNALTPVLHNLPPGDWAAGERGLAILPDRVDEFRDGVGRAVDYATTLGCAQLNCLAGLVPAGSDPVVLRETFVANLRFAAAALARENIKLLIEPINTRDMPGFFLHRTAQADALITDVGSDNLFIQYDVYHAHIMEGDLARAIERYLPRIAHIQVADSPGRHEPGTGEIAYPFLFRHLDAIGYCGWVSGEYHPKAGTTDGLGWRALAGVSAR